MRGDEGAVDPGGIEGSVGCGEEANVERRKVGGSVRRSSASVHQRIKSKRCTETGEGRPSEFRIERR